MQERVTALISKASNRSVVSALKDRGDQVLTLPEPVGETRSGGNVSADIGSFEWILFGDIRAADGFVSRLEESEADLSGFDSVFVCSAGEAVADRLRFSEIHTDLIPLDVSSKGVLESIAKYCGGIETLGEMRFLLLFSGSGHFLPAAELTAAGARVVEERIWDPMQLSTADSRSLALVKGGAFDRFVFVAAADVYDLAELIYPANLHETLEGSEVIAEDSQAWGALRERSVVARIGKHSD